MTASELREPDRPEAPEPGWLERFRDRDHTQGSLYGSLMVLSLPMVATSLFGGVIFQMGDLKLISGLGTDSMTAVIITNQTLRQVFVMFVMGASFGAQGMVARAIGNRDQEAADHVAGQVILLGAGLSIFMASLGIFFPAEMLKAMRVSPQVLEVGVPYVRLVMILNFGMIFVFLTNSILTGAGDTTTPFMVSVIQALVALFAEYCLIYGKLGAPALGIRGAALGLICGHLVSISIIVWTVARGKTRIHLRLRHLRPDVDVLKRIVRQAWPPALQMLSSFLVTIYFVRMMGGFGETAQAAYSIGLRLGMVGPMIAFPLAGATATLIGQNLGAGNRKRAWKALWVGLSIHATLMIALAIALFFYRVPFLEAFSSDAAVVKIGDEMLFYQSLTFISLAFYFVFFRALQGAGDVMFAMFASLANSIFNIALGTYLAVYLDYGPSGIFISGLTSSVLVTAVTAAWIATGRWTRRSRLVRPGLETG
ncbi:MAG: MATE family efflux transporter [Deltaproteobacteria bacterium]|nr:MATE family efflux transporter [Deltaproteobacteria bacterium]